MIQTPVSDRARLRTKLVLGVNILCSSRFHTSLSVHSDVVPIPLSALRPYRLQTRMVPAFRSGGWGVGLCHGVDDLTPVAVRTDQYHRADDGWRGPWITPVQVTGVNYDTFILADEIRATVVM